MNDLFEGAEVISCYTWDNAVEDGMFVNVSGIAKGVGYTVPVALTRSVFSLLEGPDDGITDRRIRTLLMLLAIHIKEQTNEDATLVEYHATLGEEDGVTTLWATIEGRSPKNPELVMTIMLPSDY